jgi:zinc transport system permease protein
MLILVALVIVINIRVAGIILVISYLTIPQSTAKLFVNDLKKIIILSMIISFTGSVIGLIISYYWNIPSGATIIFVFVLIFMIARLLKYLLNRKQRNLSVTGN